MTDQTPDPTPNPHSRPTRSLTGSAFVEQQG